MPETQKTAPISSSSAEHARAHSCRLLAAVRLIALALSTLVIYSAFRTHLALTPEARRLPVAARWTRRWFSALRLIMGVRITVRGQIPQTGTFIAPNHLGYMDIVALGSILECFFVGRADIATWPVMGALFTSSRHIGVAREDKRVLASVVDAVRQRLEERQSVCVFLEGTSSGGESVLPFRPSLAQAAIGAEAPVVPVGMCWSARAPRIQISEDVAYWKDHVFGSHIWRLLGLRGIQAEIIFGEPLDPRGQDRKSLACAIQAEVVRLRIGHIAY